MAFNANTGCVNAVINDDTSVSCSEACETLINSALSTCPDVSEINVAICVYVCVCVCVYTCVYYSVCIMVGIVELLSTFCDIPQRSFSNKKPPQI